MLIPPRKGATITPAIRLALQQAVGADRDSAQQYGIGVNAVHEWHHRTTVHDMNHLQITLNAV